MLNKQLVVTITLVAILISGTSGNNGYSQTPQFKNLQSKTEGWLEKTHIIFIYGKIVDQNNDAVTNASVEVSWREVTIDLDLKVRSATFRTDSEGLFVCSITNGTMPIIRGVRKQGYEFLQNQNKIVELPMEVQGKELASSSPDQPVTLVLRKKDKSTFLLHKEGLMLRNPTGEVIEDTLDVLQKRGVEVSDSDCFDDVRVLSTYEHVRRKWMLTFLATNGTDGLIVDTNLLYVAPQEGYQRKAILVEPSVRSYVYLRSRNPAIYSRIELDPSIWNVSETNEGLRVDFKAWINPYGSRNLEYETELDENWQLRKLLEADARKWLQINVLPPEPDLSSMMKTQTERE